MQGINMLTVSGRFGKTPEMSFTGKGLEVTKATFAVTVWNGQKQEEQAMWLNLVAFGKKAKYIDEFCQKGTGATLIGQLQISHFTGKDGVEKTYVGIVLNESSVIEITSRRKEKVVADDTPESPIDLDDFDFSKPF